MTATTVGHDHVPIFRVVRNGWPNPLDATFSQSARADNRWNTDLFPALYCCCSEAVARGVTRHIFQITASSIDDLQETFQPQLVEIEWSGAPIDMINETAIVLAGFEPDYPVGTGHERTRTVAMEWHRGRAEGVLCRSNSLACNGFTNWSGDHQSWSELAVFPENCQAPPSLLNRRKDSEWLRTP